MEYAEQQETNLSLEVFSAHSKGNLWSGVNT
jgi:hypothetical protein